MSQIRNPRPTVFLNHDIPFRNVFELMIEDAIRSMGGFEDDTSSMISTSTHHNHNVLSCITEKTYGETESTIPQSTTVKTLKPQAHIPSTDSLYPSTKNHQVSTSFFIFDQRQQRRYTINVTGGLGEVAGRSGNNHRQQSSVISYFEDESIPSELSSKYCEE